MNVQVKVVNICAKLRLTNSRNNEKRMNVPKNLPYLLFLNSIKQQFPLLKLDDISRLTSVKNTNTKKQWDKRAYLVIHGLQN